jgi:hypothetical protein
MLAHRLQALAADRELLARMSLAALKRFQLQPTWAQSMEAIRGFLLQMLKSWKRRSMIIER